jgi:hypothetical protein
MQLPRGITGFRSVDDPALPVTDLAAFRTHCYEAARALSGRVRSVETPANDPHGANFARAVLELPDGPVTVLLNAHSPVIAFAEALNENGASVRFIDQPALAVVFRSLGSYEVWSSSKLDAPVTSEACKPLASSELKQVKYWRPRRIGDLVFNYWD